MCNDGRGSTAEAGSGLRHEGENSLKTDYQTLIVKQEGPIVDVVLNRPEARNAVTFLMTDEFDGVLKEAMEDDEVRVVTLRGAGKIFSAGHDLKEVAPGFSTTGLPEEIDPHAPRALRRAWYFSKPLIAGVHGFVGPAAQDLLSNFDFVIAAEGTRFSFEQTRISGGGPGGTPLVFQIPMRVWKKMLMMGGWFDAEQAHEFHLVQRVVAEEEVETEVRKWAQQIAKIPSKNVQLTKMGIHRQYELMGLVNMEAVQNQLIAHGTPEDMAWWKEVATKGNLKEALRERDRGFDAEVARI